MQQYKKSTASVFLFLAGLLQKDPVLSKESEWGLTVKGHEGSYWGYENILKLIYGDGCISQENY